MGGRAGLFGKNLAGVSPIRFLINAVKHTGRITTIQKIVYATQLWSSSFIARVLFMTLPAAGIRALIEKLINE
ncbi:MAG: hypothetical protein LBR37_02080 [Erysipelotrichaceae bacterium]|nr:hypothetical protein [Erysipelotrichaceae bacterium]